MQTPFLPSMSKGHTVPGGRNVCLWGIWVFLWLGCFSAAAQGGGSLDGMSEEDKLRVKRLFLGNAMDGMFSNGEDEEDYPNFFEDETERTEEISVPSPEEQRQAQVLTVPPQPPSPQEEGMQVYGMSLFSAKTISFTPSFQVPIPEDYVVGYGDKLLVTIWGASEKRYSLRVSRQGNITIPKLGVVKVGGLHFGDVAVRLRAQLARIYTGISTHRKTQANTFVDISLGPLRGIKVHVIGEAQVPGTYTLPGLSTLFHAIYYAGGPNKQGSLRKIELIRAGQHLATLDLYEYLAGKLALSTNHRLQDGDFVRVPVYAKRITLAGTFKRPGYYEIKDQENFKDLLTFSGGFSSDAYQSKVQIVRNKAGKRTLLTQTAAQYAALVLQDGDVITGQKIVDVYVNRVQVHGAILRPGDYQWREGMRVKELVTLADGLREDALASRAVLHRRQLDYTFTSTRIDIGKIFRGGEVDVLLKNGDKIFIPSLSEIKETPWVQVFGEVNQEGQYPYRAGMDVGELIIAAKGLRYAADVTRVEIAQRITSAATGEKALSDIQITAVHDDWSTSTKSIALKPFDQVFIRRNPNYHEQKFVLISGEVRFPGLYVLQRKDENLSSIIKRAGGFTEKAYPRGASLDRLLISKKFSLHNAIRPKKSVEIPASSQEISDKILKKNEKEFLSADINARQKNLRNQGRITVGIKLDKAIENPNNHYDIQLREGDRVFIPRILQSIFVRTGVLNPIAISYRSNYSITDYIDLAGGFKRNADKRNVYIRQANGFIKRRKRYLLFFYSTPSIAPGAEIVIPERSLLKAAIPFSSILTISGSLVTFAALTYTAISTFSRSQ